MAKFDPDDPRASYRLVADTIRDRIQDGTYEVGRKLPPHQEVADEFGVSVGTVKKAYALLQEAKLITPKQGMGTYVRQRTVEPPPETGMTLADAFEQIAKLSERLAVVEQQLRSHG